MSCPGGAGGSGDCMVMGRVGKGGEEGRAKQGGAGEGGGGGWVRLGGLVGLYGSESGGWESGGIEAVGL